MNAFLNLIPSEEKLGEWKETAKKAGLWIGGALFVLGTGLVLLQAPLSIAEDTEKLAMTNLIAMAYGIQLPGAKPPADPNAVSGDLKNLNGLFNSFQLLKILINSQKKLQCKQKNLHKLL